MDIFENQYGIKSKGRVQELGEVYTPKHIVNDMLNLDGIKVKASQIDATFLEPSCGNGNFIAEIIARKIKTVLDESNTQEEFDINMLRTVASTYGIDIMHDNVIETRERIISIIVESYKQSEYELTENISKSIEYIVNRNIIFGNTLTCKMKQMINKQRKRKNSIVDEFKSNLTFSYWEFNNNMIKRRMFSGTDINMELSIKYKETNYRELYKLMELEEEEEITL